MRLYLVAILLLPIALAGEIWIDASSVEDKYCTDTCTDSSELVFGPDNVVYARFDLERIPNDAIINEAVMAFKLKSGTDPTAEVYTPGLNWTEDNDDMPGLATDIGLMDELICPRACNNQSDWYGTNDSALIDQIELWMTGTPNYGVAIASNDDFSTYSAETGNPPFLYVNYERDCVDSDEDGFGVGDCAGPTDCNDSNAAIHPGAVETCNYLDDNCNNDVDDTSYDCLTCENATGVVCNMMEYCREGFADVLNESRCCLSECRPMCTEGAVRECGNNTGACEFGQEVCHANEWGECLDGALPSTEICNNIDDDCDDVVDNWLDPEVCQCTEGAPSTETCDGKDNNCDDIVDNVVDTQTCACFGGSPGAEVCDKIDNDCNGIIDDTDSPQTCQCYQGKSPATEICNNIDDDCNGIVDDVALTEQCQCYNDKDPISELCNGVDDDCDGVIDNACKEIIDEQPIEIPVPDDPVPDDDLYPDDDSVPDDITDEDESSGLIGYIIYFIILSIALAAAYIYAGPIFHIPGADKVSKQVSAMLGKPESISKTEQRQQMKPAVSQTPKPQQVRVPITTEALAQRAENYREPHPEKPVEPTKIPIKSQQELLDKLHHRPYDLTQTDRKDLRRIPRHRRVVKTHAQKVKDKINKAF